MDSGHSDVIHKYMYTLDAPEYQTYGYGPIVAIRS
jgi:hypothetical protein